MNYSYSSLELLHTCPRKFELEKLCAPEGTDSRSLDLIAGTATHAGIQAALEGKDVLSCCWETYKAWVIEEGIDAYETSKKKSLTKVLMHVQKFHAVREEILPGWTLATITNGHGITRPAIEVGFRISLPKGDYYRGWIDCIITDGREFVALELKTTGMKNADPAMYANSFQGMSYAQIVDYITGRSNPQQFFLAFEFGEKPTLDQTLLPFWRSQVDKQSWLPSLALDLLMVRTYAKANHFPMRGDSCYKYFRPCPHLGICNLSRPGNYNLESADESALDYDFNFTLDELQTGTN